MRTAGDPGLDERSDLSLRAGCRQTSFARVPRPSNERVLCHVFLDFRETASAVARAILELQTDFGERFALPGHGGRSESPVRVTRDAGNRGSERCDVRVSMA